MSRKIYHLHPLVAGPLAEWPGHFDRIQAMGFDAVCVAPPFLPGEKCDIFVTSDSETLHPLLRWNSSAESGLAWAARAASERGLLLMLDVALDRFAVSAAVCRRHPGWFRIGLEGALPDPRRPAQPTGLAFARFDRSDAADDLATWWIERLERQMQAGVQGFRFLRPDRVPLWLWRRLTAALQANHPAATLLAWTPHLSPNAAASLEGAGFGSVSVETARWDGHSSCLVESIEALRRIAPVLVAPESSFSTRLAGLLPPDSDVPGAYRHALRVAATLGSGLFVPAGFEFAARRAFDSARAEPADWEAARQAATVDLTTDITEANALVDRVAGMAVSGATRTLTAASDAASGVLRTDAVDVRQASHAALVLINPDIVRPVRLPFALDTLPPQAGAAWVPRKQLNGLASLAPGEVRLLEYMRSEPVTRPDRIATVQPQAVRAARIAIEAITPAVPDGAFLVKGVVGQPVVVEADVFADGHEMLAASLLWRPANAADWQRVEMRPGLNDRWQARFRPTRVGAHEFTVEAWWDVFGTFRHDVAAKHAAGQDVALEIEEGRGLLQAAVGRVPAAALDDALALLRDADQPRAVEALLSAPVLDAMRRADDRPFVTRHTPAVPLQADRPQAMFASWYELFPRSATDDPARHGTFRDVIRRLPSIRAMGFDVLYFPPIHPIGTVNRKGRNNALRAAPGDVGSPYAIGSAAGGHDAVHPDLGTLEDFRRLIAAAKDNGLELALDFAVQCAPDHPWLREHKDWFRWRPDGSMRYAENPPKKYEDIVNPDFYAEAAMPSLWLALRDVVQFWVDQGVRIFRVDNPHTKPLPFWRWMIADIQSRHPDVLFLAEAFTRPKLMYRLAKLGFSQSYTYFTWRNTRRELTEYLTELNTPPVSDFFRPNFFVNTPDINPVYLQTSGRAGFLIRAALAATMSGLWGVYSGFELCESAPLPGREEYLDSEKYEIRPRDARAPGDIVDEITVLNRIRRAHPALQTHLGVTFAPSDNEQVLCYGKRVPGGREIVLMAVSLDPHGVQESAIEVPLWQFGLPDEAAVLVTDLMQDEAFVWHGKYQRVRLDPAVRPFAIWRVTVPGGAA